MNFLSDPIRLIDAHVEGLLTRIVVSGGPALVGATMPDRLADFRARHDAWRLALSGPPRSAPGTRVALLTEPERPGSLAGVLFLDADGPAPAGPGVVIAVIAALAHLGRLRPGPVQLDTPTGAVTASFALDGSVRVDLADGDSREGRAHLLLDGTMLAEPDDPRAWG